MKYRIEQAGTEYVLIDDKENLVTASDDPRKLSNYAFAHGAVEVRHDYSLVAFAEKCACLT